MTPDEKFNLSVCLSWERKKVQIVDCHDLIVQLHEHHNIDYGLTESKEKDLHHPQGALSVINALVPPIDQANEGYVYSNDSDIDYMLSDCDSDDNEFGEDYYDETNERHLKSYLTSREGKEQDTVATLEKRGMDSSIHKESPSCALIVAPRHASDNIQVTVEVENIRTNNLCDAKKHKAVIQTWPPSSKNLVKRKRMEGSNDAVWVDLRGDYRRGEHKDRKQLDKGKASIFLPWRYNHFLTPSTMPFEPHGWHEDLQAYSLTCSTFDMKLELRFQFVLQL
ncbi:hypothetical protein WN944_018689 [Citrus x changshan-huyou]|uniref:Uncharacterized protein n=1 Tax=Citrus x changshan-huyou TaxID=2935761 RepID=A0AAP0LTV8_9ROSI